MLDQENDPYLDDGWLTADYWLTRFRKTRDRIVGRAKGEDSPSSQGTQYYEEELFVWERTPIRTYRQ